MRNPKDLYTLVVREEIETPIRVKGRMGKDGYGYVKTLDELKQIFAREGFKIEKNAWKGYIDTWIVAGYIINIPDSELYVFTEKGIERAWGGKTLMEELRHIARENDALVLA